MPSAASMCVYALRVRNGKSCEAKMNDIRALNENNSFIASAAAVIRPRRRDFVSERLLAQNAITSTSVGHSD